MSEKKRNDFAKDPIVTAVSLIAIGLQSLIIILGYTLRWDWLAWECAAVLIIPAVIILCYGVKAIIQADQLMSAGIKELEGKEDGQVED